MPLKNTMNKKIQSKFAPYPFLTILLCTVACTLRTVAAFLGVDAYGYFENSNLYKVSVWIVVFAILILLTLPLAYRKRQDVLSEQTTPHTYLPSLMLGMLFLFFVGEGVFSFVGTIFLLNINTLSYLLAVVLALCSSIYFFSLALLESTTNDRKANLGMASVLFFGVYSAYLYLDTSIARNAHIEVSEEMMFVALSLYFLYEVRISLGKQKQNLYVMFAMMSGVLCAYNTIPTLIYYIVTGRLLTSSLTVFLLSCGVLLFILMRLALFEKSPTDAPIPLVKRLVQFASARSEAVRETETRYLPQMPPQEETSVVEAEEPDPLSIFLQESETLELAESSTPEEQTPTVTSSIEAEEIALPVSTLTEEEIAPSEPVEEISTPPIEDTVSTVETPSPNTSLPEQTEISVPFEEATQLSISTEEVAPMTDTVSEEVPQYTTVEPTLYPSAQEEGEREFAFLSEEDVSFAYPTQTQAVTTEASEPVVSNEEQEQQQ